MSATWGAGAPTAHLPANYSDVAAEDHRYIKWDTSVQVTHDAYLRAACKGSASKEPAAFVTEWSLSVPDNVENSADWSKDGQKDFYKKVCMWVQSWRASCPSRPPREKGCVGGVGLPPMRRKERRT